MASMRVVRAHSRLRQAVTGIQGWQCWVTQDSKAAAGLGCWARLEKWRSWATQGFGGGGSDSGMQGTKAAGEPGVRRAAAVTLGLRARWEGEEYEVWFVWPSLPGLYRGNWGSRRAIFVPFRYSLRNLAQMVFLY